MFFSKTSFFSPKTKFGPIILTLYPLDIVPENTLPNALNLPLSLVGTILETYIINGPFGSQSLIAIAHGSSEGP